MSSLYIVCKHARKHARMNAHTQGFRSMVIRPNFISEGSNSE